MKSRYFSPRRVLLLMLYVLSMPWSVASPSAWQWQLGAGALNFDYAEYNDSNQFLDGETGWLPGVVGSARYRFADNAINIEGSYYSSVVDYDGQTQASVPLSTLSDADILDINFHWELSPANSVSSYLGMGYHYWYRNIRPGADNNNNPVAGLLEEYSWFYAQLGVQGRVYGAADYEMGFDLKLTRMLDAQMEIDFLGFGGYDSTRVELGLRNGARISLPVEFKINPRSAFVLTPYYEIIDIGKSNLVPVTQGGNPAGFLIYEPRSETRNFGVTLTWMW